MARNRIIKPEFWADAKVGKLSFGARLLYIAMWNFADDYGIISASPRRLLGEAFENDETVNIDDVNKFLSEIEQQGQIKRYIANEKEWFEIVHFADHQRISHKSTRVNPKPSGDSPATLRQDTGPNVNGNGNDNGNGCAPAAGRGKGALDQEAEIFQRALSITNEKLTLTDERRRVLFDIIKHHDLGITKFMLAVKNLVSSSWPTKSLTYFLDNKFDAINRVDRFANAPPVANGNSPPQKTVMDAPPELKAIFNRTKRANTTT